jgi:hypothetical protein
MASLTELMELSSIAAYCFSFTLKPHEWVCKTINGAYDLPESMSESRRGIDCGVTKQASIASPICGYEPERHHNMAHVPIFADFA